MGHLFTANQNKKYRMIYFVVLVISYDLQIKRGRYNGKCDIGLCIVTFVSELQRINIDETNSVYHIKIKDKKTFDQWLEQIALHRNNRQKILEQQSPLVKQLTSSDENKTEVNDTAQPSIQNSIPSTDRLFYNGNFVFEKTDRIFIDFTQISPIYKFS